MTLQASPSHFVVSLQDSSWQFSHRGTIVGPFATKEDAISTALSQAQAASDAGDPSEVIVENEHREFETHWRAEGAVPAPLKDLSTSL